MIISPKIIEIINRIILTLDNNYWLRILVIMPPKIIEIMDNRIISAADFKCEINIKIIIWIIIWIIIEIFCKLCHKKLGMG